MWIIGCDLHTRYQQVAALETTTGELVEHRLEHEGEAVRQFYAALPAGARIGIEATGHAQWFERLLAELGHELWVGDAAEIRAAAVRQQKTDARDAQLLLQLLVEKRFPRIWFPSGEERETRRLLLHREKLLRMRTTIRNQLQALAMNQGVRRRRALWSAKGRRELEALPLGRWSSTQRRDLLALAEVLDGRIEALNQAVIAEAARGASLDATAGGGAGDRAGVPADAGAGRALPAEQAGGELSGIEPARVFLGRTAAARRHQQARQHAGALAAGGGGADGRPTRPRTAPRLCAAETPPRVSHRQGGGGPKVGSALVLEVAHARSARATGEPAE
jgi:hypothetical protein